MVNYNAELNRTRTLKYADSPAGNPLKGFVGNRGTGSHSDFPLSLEYAPMPLGSLIVGERQYDWTLLEAYLNEIVSYRRQSIVSFYMDFPNKSIGKNDIPKYLIDKGVEIKEYIIDGLLNSNGEVTCYSPDYNNPLVWEMAHDFIKALAQKYDGDPRIAQIEASIIGTWGEWHTCRKDFGITDEKLITLTKVYDDAFSKTQISCRYPKEGATGFDVGYSDYSFCGETIKVGWSQLNRLKQYDATEYWKKNMGGGELMPQYVAKIFETEKWSIVDGESYSECLQALHPSWMLVGGFGGFETNEERAKAIQASQMLGYDFSVTEATFDTVARASKGNLNLNVKIKNIGLAPFYYNWKVKIGVLDKTSEVKTYLTDWDLRTILADGKEYEFSGSLPNLDLQDGKYSLGLYVENPLLNGKKLMFANETQRVDGWLLLGDFIMYNDIPKMHMQGVAALNKCDLDVTLVDFQETVLFAAKYKIGVRIRNFGDSQYTGTDNPIINIYKNGALIKEFKTNWDLSTIKPDNHMYFAWFVSGLEAGKHEIKMKITPDTKEVLLGYMNVVESLEMDSDGEMIADIVEEEVIKRQYQINLNIVSEQPESIFVNNVIEHLKLDADAITGSVAKEIS